MFSNLMVQVSHYTQRLATMRICSEYVATTSVIVQRHHKCFAMVASSIWPHGTLKTGYTQAGPRRIVWSHVAFIDWISARIEKRSCLRVQCKTMPYVSSNLGCAQLDGSCVWDGASVTPQLECLLVVAPAFMARTPERWRLVMLELNYDIYDASKKLVVGSVSASKMNTGDSTDVETNLGGPQGTDAAPGTVVDWAASHQHEQTVRLPPAN